MEAEDLEASSIGEFTVSSIIYMPPLKMDSGGR